MESFTRVDERALELLYAFSDYTVPPEQLLASEEVVFNICESYFTYSDVHHVE